MVGRSPVSPRPVARKSVPPLPMTPKLRTANMYFSSFLKFMSKTLPPGQSFLQAKNGAVVLVPSGQGLGLVMVMLNVLDGSIVGAFGSVQKISVTSMF